MSKLTSWKEVVSFCVLCAVVAIGSPAQTFNTLVNFDGTNGSEPYLISLVQGSDGNLYGTTLQGGASGLGTVFKMTPTGTLTTLHSFAGSPTDGALPYPGLVQATNTTSTAQPPRAGAATRASMDVARYSRLLLGVR
jgi:uncharacterized repeat protein (TIGR03803 family)